MRNLNNKKDINGKRQGYWVEETWSGRISKGHYIDSVKEGVWVNYRKHSDIVSYSCLYKNGVTIWESDYYYDGSLKTSHNYFYKGAIKHIEEYG